MTLKGLLLDTRSIALERYDASVPFIYGEICNTEIIAAVTNERVLLHCSESLLCVYCYYHTKWNNELKFR